MSSTGTPPPVRLGRPPSSSRGEIEHVAISLFEEKGFDETTVDEIATAAGIGRRTFFRYYPSKNDVPWGDFGTGLASMRADLAAQPADRDVLEALQGAVLAFNDFDPGETVWHRRRMRLLLEVPALTAHSALK